MTDDTRNIHLVIPMTPEEIEASRAQMKVYAAFPVETFKVAIRLVELAEATPELAGELREMARKLNHDGRLAHACSTAIWDVLRKGVLHEAKGSVQ